MAAPPDLINDPPSLICRYKDRKTSMRARARLSSLLSIAVVFFLLSSSFLCSIFSNVCTVTDGTKGSERKSDSERENETNVYFGLARAKERIEREEDTFPVLSALKIIR